MTMPTLPEWSAYMDGWERGAGGAIRPGPKASKTQRYGAPYLRGFLAGGLAHSRAAEEAGKSV